MGYILPVRSYQYNEYQRRMRIDSHDPMRIDKIFPAVFASQYYDIAKEYTNPKNDFIEADEKVNHSIVAPENIYARLTGKGRNFNKSV